MRFFDKNEPSSEGAFDRSYKPSSEGALPAPMADPERVSSANPERVPEKSVLRGLVVVPICVLVLVRSMMRSVAGLYVIDSIGAGFCTSQLHSACITLTLLTPIVSTCSSRWYTTRSATVDVELRALWSSPEGLVMN